MAHKSIARLLVRPGSVVNLARRKSDDTLGWDKEEAKAELAEVRSAVLARGVPGGGYRVVATLPYGAPT